MEIFLGAQKLKYIILYIPLVILILISIVILLPIVIYRYVVSKFVHWQDPMIGPILSGITAFFCNSDPYKEPNTVVLAYIPLKQKIIKDEFVKLLRTQLIAPNYYPNLKQYLVKKYGYFFWRNVDNFSLENHVRHFQPFNCSKPVTTAEERTWYLKNKLTFDPSQSPWEFLIIENYIDSTDPTVKSMVILKVNHCLMDGYSLLAVLGKLTLKPWKIHAQGATRNKTPTTGFNKLRNFLHLLVAFPNVLTYIFECFTDKNESLIKAIENSNKRMTYRQHLTHPQAIPLDRLKAVKNAYGVSLASLITTIASIAVANQFKRQFGKFPEKMLCPFVLPWPDHPDKLTNHCTVTHLFAKVVENDPKKTLLELEKTYLSVTQSKVPAACYYLLEIVGLLPVTFLSVKRDSPLATLALTNIPGPETNTGDLCGYVYDRLHIKVTPRNTGFFFVSNSMGSKLFMDVEGLDTILPSNADAKKFANSFQEILQGLENAL